MSLEDKPGAITEVWCRTCKRKNKHDILHVQDNSGLDDAYGGGELSKVHVTDLYQTVACRGCGTVALAHYGFCDEALNPEDYPVSPTIYPRVPLGNELSQQHLPREIHDIYEEARHAAGGEAPTGAVLLCRTLLAHIAVEKGADKGKTTFNEYIGFLLEKGYLPPEARPWVDSIREKANEATHDLTLFTPRDAYVIVQLVELMLRVIYIAPKQLASADSIPPWELPPR